jgi:hypothetical protein
MLAQVQRLAISVLALPVLACTHVQRPQVEPGAEYAAVRACARDVAVGEGFFVSDTPASAYIATSSLPRDSVSWVESLVLRVRVYSDSVLPEASVRRVRYNARNHYPLSSAGRRIQDRVNEECRIARAGDRKTVNARASD